MVLHLRRHQPGSVPVAAFAVLLLAAGCVTRPPPAPVEDRTAMPPAAAGSAVVSAPAQPAAPPGIPLDGHLVVSGDTLYGIAWRYGIDYREIARLNGIDPPYRIFVGQRLQLQAPPNAPLAAAPGTAVAAATTPLPAEPVSRGFEFVPETPASSETWQDVPPPQQPVSGAPAIAGVPAGSVPGAVAPAAAPMAPPMTAPGAAQVTPPSTVPVQTPMTAPSAAPVTGPVTVPPGTTASAAATTAPAVTPLPQAAAPVTAPAPSPVAPPVAGTAPVVAAPAAAPEPATRPVQPARTGGSVGSWRWPTKATVQKGFCSGSKGVDFKLEPAQPVLAAGGGEVVYAGNGLGGFRHLVIVKHDQRFLSAYSLNRAISVQEGQRLDSGAIIAAADPSGAASTLRFEIRKDGQPVDPVSVIGR
jgi:lipoprotein NlpD